MRTGFRRLVVAGCAAAALVGVGLASGTATGSSPATSRPARLTALNCPGANYPHAGDTSPYEIPFTGSLSSTIDITSTPVGAIDLPPVSGTFCGVIQLPQETAVVEPADLSLSSIQVRIARATVPSTIAATGNAIGQITGQAPDGGLELTLNVPVAAGTGLFGVDCKLPVELNLTTTATGLTGPLSDSHLTATETGFAIGSAQSTGASGTCPSYLAQQVDSLISLPNYHTVANANIGLDIDINAA
jgi:hypothetical protein